MLCKYSKYNVIINCFFRMNITSNLKHLTPSKNVKYNGCILGLDEIDSSFFYQSYPCINNYEHSDLPALQVCLIFLSQEGVSAR